MKITPIACLATLLLGTAAAQTPSDGHSMQHHQPVTTNAPAAAESPNTGHAMVDTRQLVAFPPMLRTHTLANMRDHLATLGRITEALSRSDLDLASSLAESRLGMSSLEMHGAHEVARYMPDGMQEAGTAMHRSASQFAVVAKDASVTGDLEPVLAALARLNQTCVACHAGYALK